MLGQGSCTSTAQHFMKHWQARPGGSLVVGATIWLLARSLARSFTRLVLSFSSSLPPPTHLAVVRRNAHVCFVRYFGLDKDGEAETPKDGRLVDVKEKESFALTLARVFLLYLKEKFTTFVQSVTHAVYSIDLFYQWWIYRVNYRSINRSTKRKFRTLRNV